MVKKRPNWSSRRKLKCSCNYSNNSIDAGCQVHGIQTRYVGNCCLNDDSSVGRDINVTENNEKES